MSRECDGNGWRGGSDTFLQCNVVVGWRSAFIVLATLLLQSELPVVALLDEPELGLQPRPITLLAELLSSAANSYTGDRRHPIGDARQSIRAEGCMGRRSRAGSRRLSSIQFWMICRTGSMMIPSVISGKRTVSAPDHEPTDTHSGGRTDGGAMCEGCPLPRIDFPHRRWNGATRSRPCATA